MGSLIMSNSPFFSIIMPVYNVEAKFAERAIESLKEQFYENWELCIADDHSQKPDLTNLLKKKAAEDNSDRVLAEFAKLRK